MAPRRACLPLIPHIEALGKRAGVVINPAIPTSVLEEVLPDPEQVLVMNVNPGLGISRSCTRQLTRSASSAG
jgi:ribulose-phosphate 3-epimerase